MSIFGLYLYLLGESYQDGYLSDIPPYQDTARFICSRDFDSNIFVDTRHARLLVTSMLPNCVYRLYYIIHIVFLCLIILASYHSCQYQIAPHQPPPRIGTELYRRLDRLTHWLRAAYCALTLGPSF